MTLQQQGFDDVMSKVKRSSNDGMQSLAGDNAHISTGIHGVGARHESTPGRSGWGGSRNICTIFDDAVASHRVAGDGIAKLRRIGLSRAWIDVAESIGFAAFVAMWQKLADHELLDGRGRIVVPLFSAFIRHERNDLMRRMIAAGNSDRQIVDAVKRKFDEIPNRQYLQRLRASR